MITDKVTALLSKFDKSKISLHMHDTSGMALTNIYVALMCGITSFDSSVTGDILPSIEAGCCSVNIPYPN